MRTRLEVRTGTCLSLKLFAAVMALTAGFAAPALAKPTGWQSETELRSGGAGAWSGYNETGYAARPRKSRADRAKSAALRKYASKYQAKRKTSGTKSVKDRSLTKYAALDTGAVTDAAPSAKSLTGGGVRWAASSSCLNGALAAVVQQVADSYGSVTVNSTCRSKAHNRKVGGAPRSQHLTGNAVDFRVHGNVGAAYAFLRSNAALGGVKHYGGGLFHIDTGPKRTW